MRIRIEFDGATTRQVRDLSVAVHRATGANRLTVGVEGPECWGGVTPNLTPDQFAVVVANLVKNHGELIAEALDRMNAAGSHVVTAPSCDQCDDSGVVDQFYECDCQTATS